MKVLRKKVTIKELTEGYVDNKEEGVRGYDGKLDIRPAYQREFVYDDKKRDLVIDSVLNEFPLSTMYWNLKDDGTFEVLDGQQRTISICQYVSNDFSFKKKMFARQPKDIREKFLKYELDVYYCHGTESQRIDWFQIINIAGKPLNTQDILNAIYVGPWTSAAREKFSKTKCKAYQLGKQFMSGKPIEQDYLEAVLKWISDDDVRGYMNQHATDPNADELWDYYENVIDWVKAIFVGGQKSNIRKDMKSVKWGVLYNKFGDKKIDSEKIQTRVAELFIDEDITKPVGIYEYVLGEYFLEPNEKHLNIRAFKDRDKQVAYEKQKGICANKKSCPRGGKKCELSEMHADHITPWSKGGKTELDNCQMLCVDCNRRKGAI